MKNCWLAIVALLLSTAAFAQAVGPESLGDSFTAPTTAASLAADRSGAVLAWVRPQANGQSRVYTGRTDGSGRIVAQELVPFGATPSFTFDWPAIASDGNDTVVVARQNSTATIGWAISRSALPQLMSWSAAPPALAAANGRFYVVGAVDPATGGQTSVPDEIARAQSATVYARTINPASPLPCIIGFCGPAFASYQGRTSAATFTADSIGAPQTDSAPAWQQTTGAGVSFVSGQSATIAASPKDWIVLSRTADDAVPGPLVAWRYSGDGTSAPSVAAPIVVTIIAAEPSAVRPPDGTRFWYARAAFDGQRYGIAWQERSPRGDHDIWFATIDADNRVSAPILVAGSTSDERRPLITATGSGSFFVAYDSGNGTSVRVAGRSVTLLASRRRAAAR